MEHSSPQGNALDAQIEALVGRMTDAQRLRFRTAVVRQSIHYVSQALPPESADEGERACIQVATDWLADPSDARAQRAGTAAYLDHCDGGVRYHDYAPLFWEPVWVLVSSTAVDAARCCATGSAREQASEARRWQLRAAEAILADADPPPLE